jgi:tetratricopeptide (TPR) repeat protein
MAAVAVLLLAAPFSWAGGSPDKTGGLSLQDAIEQSAEKIAGEFPPGTRVAIVAFEADSDKLSDFIRTELAAALINRGIEVVARHSIEYINRELDFQMSGQVSDETALSVGKYAAAEVLIIGRLQNLGDIYRLTTTTTRVEQATHAGIPRFDVRNDRALKNMIAALDKQPTAAAALPAVNEIAPPQTVGTFLDRGILFAMRGEYEMAIADFTEAIKLAPNLATAYMLRGRALYASVSTVTAVAENFSGINTISTGGRVSVEQAQIYDRAIADYTQAIRFDPHDAGAYDFRGIAYADKGDFDQAIADFTQAIRLDPNAVGTYSNRGNTYAIKRDYDRAIADYTQAIRLNPNYTGAYYNRGITYRRKGDNDQAIADYTQAIRLDPNAAGAYNNRGGTYASKGDYDRAIADYTQAIKLNPNYMGAYYNRGITYGEKGDYDRAIADYTQVIRLDPNNADAYNNRGWTYALKGDYDRAIEDANISLRIRPNDDEALHTRGYAYVGKRDYDRAIADFEAALRINPNHTDARRDLEAARQQRGR